jgi:hypothetical protein
MEWDSLVIIPEFKIMINIEVKRGKGFNSLKKAASQTKIHLSIFKKIFGSLLSDGWKFVKAAFTPSLELTEDKQPCEDCKQFILQQVDYLNMKPWIQRLMSSSKKYIEDDYVTEYDDLLVEIIGFSSIRQSDNLNKLIVNPKEFSKETERKLTAQNSFIQAENEEDRNKLREANETEDFKSEYLCYMLTADQLMAVKDPSSLLIIDGDYGCGKTYVLKERTKQCAEKFPKSKIVYINIIDNSFFNDHNPAMLDMIAENNFKNYSNVDVVTTKDLYDHYVKHEHELGEVNRLFSITGNECSVVLKNFLEKSTYNYIFIDEMPPFINKTDAKHIYFSTDKTYCVAMKCDKYNDNINEDWIIQMEERYNAKRIMLKHNMRNTKTIVNLSNCFLKNVSRRNQILNKASVIPNKNITGPVCYHYLNIHRFRYSMLARAAIQKYFHCPKESVLVLADNFINVNLEIYQDLLEYFSTDRNIVFLDKDCADDENHSKKTKEYLENPEGVLVTNIKSFGGAQARNIILLVGLNPNFEQIRNMILRTISFAIVIQQEDVKESFPGVVRDDNLHEFICPGNAEQLFCESEDGIHKRSCNLPCKTQSNNK